MKVKSQTTGQVQIGKNMSKSINKLNKYTKVTENPNYSVWCEMKRRCTNPNRHNYKYYGGRGIKVCDRWINSFDNFCADMGERPKGFEIDRIDNSKGYEPSNCRWVSHRDNTLNRSAYGSSKVKNVRFNKGKYEAGLRRFGKYIYLGRFDNIIQATNAVRNYES